MRTKTVTPSPVGPLTLVAEDGVLAGLFLPDHRHAPPLDLPVDRHGLPGVREQLTAWFAGETKSLDVPLRVHGTPFQHDVWAALRTIPYGETWTYRQLAEAVSRPAAVRAVGLANGRNPVSIVVPCHRALGKSGDLTGYHWGLTRKRAILGWEAGKAADGTI